MIKGRVIGAGQSEVAILACSRAEWGVAQRILGQRRQCPSPTKLTGDRVGAMVTRTPEFKIRLEALPGPGPTRPADEVQHDVPIELQTSGQIVRGPILGGRIV